MIQQGNGEIDNCQACYYHSPIHTSPKHPCPSFRSRRRDSRGISQASLARPWVWGLATGHTSVSAWHNPSECSGKKKKKIDHFDKLTFVNCWKQAGVCALTHCSSGRLTAVSWWTGYETWCRNHHCPASWSCNVWRSGLWCCHSPALTDSTPLFTSRDNRQTETDGDRSDQ